MTQEEYSKMLADAREQFKNGTPLFGREGAFHKVLEDFLNAALEGEMSPNPKQAIAVMGKCRKRFVLSMVR